MICKYSNRYSEHDDRGWYKLYCSITNQMCYCQYPCDKINNWINMDNLDKRCIYFKKEEEKLYMEQGKYKVLYEKRGMLYVELDYNTSVIVQNPYDSEIPQSVDLINIKDTYYVKGYEPKVSVSKTKSKITKIP